MTPEKERLSWDGFARMVNELAARVGEKHDVMLAVARGGLVPAGALAYRLGLRDIVVAAVALYDDDGRAAEKPEFIQFPPAELLRGRRVLVVDEVWDSGRTIEAVRARVLEAGGQPTTAVLHYKPTKSRVNAVPDHFVQETAAWVVYPWSGDEGQS